MVRTLGNDETLVKDGNRATIEERVRPATPSADELHELVHGPRRPVRWMRWLAGAVVIVAGAAIAGIMLANDRVETTWYLTPTSDDATNGTLTMSTYLPESSGEVYNYLPVGMLYDTAPEAGGPTMSAYLPETTGEVYNYNPDVATRGPNADLAPYWTATETVEPDVATRGPNADLAPYWTATETVEPDVATRGPNADLAPYWPSDS